MLMMMIVVVMMGCVDGRCMEMNVKTARCRDNKLAVSSKARVAFVQGDGDVVIIGDSVHLEAVISRVGPCRLITDRGIYLFIRM